MIPAMPGNLRGQGYEKASSPCKGQTKQRPSQTND